MKKLIFILLLIPSIALGAGVNGVENPASVNGVATPDNVNGVSGLAAAGDDYSDIIFYHDCDALDDANKSGGSGTVTYDAGILLNTTDKVVGTGCWDNNNDGYDEVEWAVSGNVDFASGRIGFYMNPQEDAAGMLLSTDGGGSGDMQASHSNSDQDINMKWEGGSTGVANTNMTTGTWYFVEFKFDGDNDTMTAYINGSSVGTATGTGGITTTLISFFSDGSATCWDMLIDQVIVSNDPNRDLNAIKNVTNFD